MIIFVVCGLFSADEIHLYHLYPRTYQFLAPAVYVVYMILPIGFALLGIAASVGLFRLREWGRRATIVLSIVPVLGCALLVLLRPRSVFPPDPGQGALLVIGGGIYLLIFELLLAILIPISIWWLFLLTRSNVRSQFR
jgi:hypothetical protein